MYPKDVCFLGGAFLASFLGFHFLMSVLVLANRLAVVMAEASIVPAEPAVNKFQSKFGERTDGQTKCFTPRPEGMGTWAEQIGHNKLIIYM